VREAELGRSFLLLLFVFFISDFYFIFTPFKIFKMSGRAKEEEGGGGGYDSPQTHV